MTGQVAPAPEADDLYSGRVPILKALETLRLRLLDLTSRNRLLNFKHSPGKCIQFVDAQPNPVFRRLMESTDRKICLNPIPDPHRSEMVTIAGRLTKPEARDYAKTLGIDPSFELPHEGTRSNGAISVRALYYSEDLERRCRKLHREMKSAIEETGAHMLFLVFGFLDFPDKTPTDRTISAPLISVPVIIEKGDLDRETRHYRYYLSYTGEELSENLSLREKLRQDHGFELPVFDEDETTPDEYFKEIQKAIQHKHGWKIKRQMTLALLSFTKMLLVRDIDPSKWPSLGKGLSGLTDHPIVRMVFEGVRHKDGVGNGLDLGKDYNIDEHPLSNIPLIYDADSSQHSALIDSLSGRNMVIEGPPGTGKSQTITNLIAVAIVEGKKVLFLSEKMAALEVVKKRLLLAGLDDFCLELHSNKTHKKRVLDAIAIRKDNYFPLPRALSPQLEALEEKRKALKAYADLLNSVVGNAQGLSVHSVLWRAERNRIDCGSEWKAAQEITIPKAHSLTHAEFTSLRDTLTHTCRQYKLIGSFGPDHPFWGFYPTELMPGSELMIDRNMQDALPHFEEFQKTLQEAAAFLGEEKFYLSPEETEALMNALVSIDPTKFPPGMSRTVLPGLFSDKDPEAKTAEATLRRFDERLKRVSELRSDVGNRLKQQDTLTKADGDNAEALKNNLSQLILLEKSCQTVEDLANEILQIAASVSRALAKINECGQIVGIEFDGSDASVEKIHAIVDIALQAPRDLLQYRHLGLKNPDVNSIIGKACADLQRIMEEREVISKILYLDVVPVDSELREAILVLREGDTWYRIFQGRWRRACRLHRTIDKTKAKKTSALRLQELERLITLQNAAITWNSNQSYREALGPLYQGEDTSFDKAMKLGSWIATTQCRLLEAGLDENIFNSLEATELHLMEIAGCQSKLEYAINDLTTGRESLKNWFQMSKVVNEKLLAATSWPLFADLLNELGLLIKDAAGKLFAWSPGNISAAESLRAVTSYLALPTAINSVDEDIASKTLLDKEFRSTETDTKPAWDALAYGRNIMLLKMPPAINCKLISDRVDANFNKITDYIKAIQGGWNIVDGFIKEMTEFGNFELACWVGKELSDADFPPTLVARTENAIKNINALLSWVQYLQQSARAHSRGLGDLISVMESGKVSPDHLPNTFGYRFYSSIAARLFRSYPTLEQFAGTTHETIRAEFAILDHDIIKLRGLECAHKTAQKCFPPQGTGGTRVDDKTELSLLNYLLPQIRPRMSIRKMMRQAGRAIQAFKPCFMMGPQAVAQFLEPGAVKFDIVIMDEASQLKPEEALGAIARGKQLIVVGDPKQLPPTTFFDRLSLTSEDGEDDGQQAAALMSQSILDVCMGHFQPVRTLRWHYRSKHESLIAFSNHNFYKNLFIFPSPYPMGKLLGVHYRYIGNGIYHDQMNIVEAKNVTDAVIDHMLNHPEDSLGVVTLNLKQRDLIDELLEQRFRYLDKTEEYRNYWEREGMGFFVKNLESVQGDERDVIFISVTFGKAKGTNVTRQNFGPVARADGWRRLNVLFTRARKAVHLFTSMRPEDIVVDTNTPYGTKILHDYLEYARSGILADIKPTGGEPDSDFEISVADVLHKHNFEVVPQLGVAGFRIDIAVKHPNYSSAYLAAIECDGATYHSGVSVRDRDRIRQEILESLGWKNRIWRIWSTDWFRNPIRETANLIAFLNELKGIPLDGAYFVLPDDTIVPTALQTEPSEQLTLKNLGVSVVETEDDEQEVEVGDTIFYFPLGHPNHELKVRITTNQNNPDTGLISKVHPLAQAMLGATVEDEVTIKDGRGQRSYIIKKIVKKESSEITS